MSIAVIIPTVKPTSFTDEMVSALKAKAAFADNLYIVNQDPERRGAAWNSNRALDQVPKQCEYVIKVDDDICNYPLHWDSQLAYPLQLDPLIVAVVPRLRFASGQYQMTCTHELNLDAGLVVESPRKVVPFCMVALRNDGTRFDENFIGTWCDDDDYCAQLRMKVPGAKFVTLNTMCVTHLDEGKGRGAAAQNGAYFGKKWGSTIFPDGKGLL